MPLPAYSDDVEGKGAHDFDAPDMRQHPDIIRPPNGHSPEGFEMLAEGKPMFSGTANSRVILVDMDNTLCDWEAGFVTAMKKHHPDVPLVPFEQRKNWKHEDDYPPEHRQIVTDVCKTDGFFRDMPAMSGGVSAVKAMKDAGFDVFIVSAPLPTNVAACSAEKTQWVEKHLGSEWVHRLILTKDKTTVRGDVLIDDKPTADEGAMTPEWKHMLFDKPYNQHVTGKPRLSGWGEWSKACAMITGRPRELPTNLYPTGINFSCVFPMFNQEEIVKKTLAGLCKQRIKSDFKFEVIILDNNSTDDVDAIYRKYREKLDLTFIQRRKLENTFSVPSGRNMGIKQAKYDFIVGMDSDVILNENFLENLYQFLSSRDPSTPYLVTAERWFVATEDWTDEHVMKDFSVCGTFPRILSKANYFKPRDNRFSHGKVLDNVREGVHPWAYFYGMHTAFPRRVWELIGGYDEVYDGWWGYDDIHFAWEMIVKGGCIPVVLGGTEVYHQEPYGSGWTPVGGVINKDGSSNPRLNKAANPNWKRICDTIPGYADWKADHYRRLAGDIVTL